MYVLKFKIASAALENTRYTFLANFNIFKRFYGLCLWGSDPLSDSFYQIQSFKGSEPHKQWPYNLLLMFFVSIKSIPSVSSSAIALKGLTLTKHALVLL